MKKTEPNETPEDVQDIIRYTKLRKKYPKLDRELRLRYCFDEYSITLEQMYCILTKLEKHDMEMKK